MWIALLFAACQPEGASNLNGPERFDRLVTLELVFPKPSDRARYLQAPAKTENGRRTYAFELRPQPGMVANRHFHLIAVTVAPAGTFLDPSRSGPAPVGSSAGPNGGFTDVAMRTGDGRFDVRVSEAMLLPDGVDEATIDMNARTMELVRRYGQLDPNP